MQLDKPTQLETSDWKTNFVTKAYVARIKRKISDIEEYIGKGKTLVRDSADTTLANTSYEVGKIKGLNDALAMISETY